MSVQKEHAVADRQYELVYILPPDTTEQQVTDLQTKCPDLVGSPTYGWHLDGNASPEPNFVGAIDLNLTGTTQASHPITCGGAAAPTIPAHAVMGGMRW